MPGTLPEPFAAWFAARGWSPRPHQLALLDAAANGESVLLIAPTGGGKTLAGFLPSLVALATPRPTQTMHTLYVSPLKALATDIARNLTAPVEQLQLPIRIETRTGDTPADRRKRQRENPPDILLTTPESLALLLSLEDAPAMFANLSTVIIDEIHALAGTKRGDQLALCLSRLTALSPTLRRVGLSATVAHRQPLLDYVAAGAPARLIEVAEGAPPAIEMMLPEERIAWSGRMGLASASAVMKRIHTAGMTIVFVNTRAQAEMLFQELWKLNETTLPIALHHGSLDLAQRRRVEAAMSRGDLRAVVATSSLDLGIDWGGVDQVIQVGAPKGTSRLLQRVGRSNHRMDEPSQAVLVPANRFEVLECKAAMLGIEQGVLDGDPPGPGGLDVLAQHILLRAASGAFMPDDFYTEIRRAAPYAGLSRKDFDDALSFVENGGYALSNYDRYRKLFRDSEGRIHITGARTARQARMNIGTIVEAPLLKVKVAGRRGMPLGEVEESFANGLREGDTFMFAGRLLIFLRIRETTLECAEGGTGAPAVPAYAGTRMSLTTNLAARVRAMLHDPTVWHTYPDQVQEWLMLQQERSELPGPDGLLVEIFPRENRFFLVAYAFEGRNAHQTLGMLLTRRMERAGYAPLGFVATEYAIAIWSANEPTGIDALFHHDLLGEDLDVWMAETSMLRRTFRNVAVISGLVDRHHPGAEKNRRQVTVNTDLIYNVLRKHQPDHILLRATWNDAKGGLTDLGRLGQLLDRAKGRITVQRLDRVSPLAVPILLDIGRESVRTEADEDAMLMETEALVAEAMDIRPGDATGGRKPPAGRQSPLQPARRPRTRPSAARPANSRPKAEGSGT